MSVFHNNALIGAGAGTGEVAAAEYVIPKSLRFNSGDSAHLDKTFASEGNRRTWTWSGWLKRSKFDQYSYFFTARSASTNYFVFNFTDDNLKWYNRPSSGTHRYATSTAVFRDAAAWYHVVIAWDTTESTDSDRVKLYVNGERITSFSASVWPAQNEEGVVNGNHHHEIGAYDSGTQYQYNGLMADVQFVDGQQLAPTDFGETRSSDGVWVPKEYTGEFGPLLDQSQNWTSLLTTSTGTITNPSYSFDGNIANTSQLKNTSAGSYIQFGVTLTNVTKLEIYQRSQSDISGTGIQTYNNAPAAQWVELTLTSSTVSNIRIEKNTNDPGIYGIRVNDKLLVDSSVSIGNNSFHLNFSDSSTIEALGFDSAPTTPDPDPKKGMDVITYSGSSSTQNIGGLNFEPGLVWIKRRTGTAKDHCLVDVVRGPKKRLRSESTAQETTEEVVTAFDPSGFTIGTDTGVNQSGYDFVAWTWAAGGSAVSNTSGTINAEVSANTDYGFSIVKWTATNASGTIGHGLTNQTPKFILVKSLAVGTNWVVYHHSIGNTGGLNLNLNSTGSTDQDYWNNTSPTTSVFSVGSFANYQTAEHVAYVWSEVSGYSKFGSYTGNGSSTGPVVTTGFKVRWLLVKRTDSTGNWIILDTEINPGGSFSKSFYADTNAAEYTPGQVWAEALSDGFQPTATYGEINASGGSYIYAAFADRPGNNWDVNNIVTNEGLTTSKDNFDVVTWTGNGGTQKIGGGATFSGTATITYDGTPDTSYTTGLTSAMFDGSTSTAFGVNNGSSNKFVNIAFATGITVSSSLKVHAAFRTGMVWKVNGNTVTSTGVSHPNTGLQTLNFTGTMNSLRCEVANGNALEIHLIEVDGSPLLDGIGPGLKFQPDFVWIKRRDDSAKDHNLYDVVRGASGGYYNQLVPNVTSVENNNSSDYGRVTALNSDGFTVDSATSDHSLVNDNGDSYVAWCWKAGGTAVSNTDGSITSQVSANPSAGFSIVSFNGTAADGTVGHGLNAKPSLYIVKNRDTTSSWFAFTDVIDGSNDYLYLDTTGAKNDTGANYANVATSSVFYMGIAVSGLNASGDDHIAYCFANVPGYQRIGSYTGNGSTTGPVVVTGFKPRFLLIKAAVGYSSGSWIIVDSERSTTNPTDHALFPNSSNIENNLPSFGDRDIAIDFLSNGFQIKNSLDADNKSSVDYIYLAIGDDEIGSDEDCLVDVPNAVTADADATDTTGGYQRGNYCTLNPLTSSGYTLSNGNLQVDSGSGSTRLLGTIGVSSGKYYFEAKFNSHTSTNDSSYLVVRNEDGFEAGIRNRSADVQYFTSSGGNLGDYTTSNWSANDVHGFALDCDNNQLKIYRNGVLSATISITADKTYFPGYYRDGSNGSFTFNFGQMRFKYPMPSGYAALNTTALPAATIPDGSAQFDTKTYTSNATARSITGYEFGPDWLWFKPRNVQGSHNLYDTVRGATKGVRSHANDAEYTDAQTVTSFNSDGFSLGTDSNGYQVNYSNNSMVVWAWNGGANSDKTYTVKVVSDSGNKYRFDDHGTSAVTLDLAEGSTYIFDQSDSSNAGHPIRFGTSANGTDYTTGVTHTGTPGSAGAKTTLVLASGAPTLYYSCANHSGMGGQINTNSTAGSTRLSGSENSVVYNQSQNYTNNVSSTSNITSGHEARLFNGILSGSNADIQSSQGTSGVINFTTAITGSKIEIYTVGNIGQIGINGSNLSVTANQFVDTGVTSLTSVETRHPSAGYVQNPTALRVDGKILVDSNVTPPAVPSINSVVKANPEAGFSIVTFTGTGSNATVNHGLNAKPDFYVVKRRSAADDWECYHSALGATYYGKLNATDVWTTSGGTARWNDTEPTSSVFSVGTTDNVNGSGSTYVAYVMSAVSGYSAFGSYEANGSADGPFVFTSFRPALVICKSADQAQPWQIFDSAREPKNVITKGLQANSTGAEYDTTARLDFLSNGFKIRAGGGSEPNVSGNTYIYLAFAENPFSANGGLAR